VVRVKEYVVILVTASSHEEGSLIAGALVKERLCACVNVVKGVRSFFWWQAEVQEEEEVLLVCKSTMDLVPAVEAMVKKLHSYTVPEVIALPVVRGLTEYLDWVSEETQPADGEEK
jgi:periplasmic divalent cation tolerance protein